MIQDGQRCEPKPELTVLLLRSAPVADGVKPEDKKPEDKKPEETGDPK